MYGHLVFFAETFIDPGRFRGTCYRAANWQFLGLTTGRGKNDQTNKPNRPIKEKPVISSDEALKPRSREILKNLNTVPRPFKSILSTSQSSVGISAHFHYIVHCGIGANSISRVICPTDCKIQGTNEDCQLTCEQRFNHGYSFVFLVTLRLFWKFVRSKMHNV